MLQDAPTQDIIKYAMSRQDPFWALQSLVRAGRIAQIYRPHDGFIPADFDELFGLSNTKKGVRDCSKV